MAIAMGSNFPKGLRVLLVDTSPSLNLIESSLRQPDLGYAVTSCSSAADALSYCRSGVSCFDVVLAEARLVAVDEGMGRAFIDAFEETPVILMSEGSTTGDVLRAVKLGAVDWLDKPLSVLKLKNIWQHSVRRMMQRTSISDGPAAAPPAAMAAADASKPALSGLRSAGAVPPCSAATTRAPSLDYPSTPTMAEPELDAISAASFGSIKDLTDFSFGGGNQEVLRASFDSGCCDGTDFYSSSAAAQQQAVPHQPRPPMAVKPSSFGPLVPVPPPSQWPQLQPGCVWGTPVGGPLPPPLGAAPQAVPPTAAAISHHNNSCGSQQGLGSGGFMTSASHLSLSSMSDDDTQFQLSLSLPAPTAADSVSIPHGFLDGDDARNERGPLGLKLKKSNSLLNMINAALSTSAC